MARANEGTMYQEQVKKCLYLLHVVGLVSGVGVYVLRHGADLPLLHDLEVAGTEEESVLTEQREKSFFRWSRNDATRGRERACEKAAGGAVALMRTRGPVPVSLPGVGLACSDAAGVAKQATSPSVSLVRKHRGRVRRRGASRRIASRREQQPPFGARNVQGGWRSDKVRGQEEMRYLRTKYFSGELRGIKHVLLWFVFPPWSREKKELGWQGEAGSGCTKSEGQD